MASRGLEGEIDRLYQLPPDEFTPARNALAKGAGGETARIRALSKPPVAAWAVNQLYWRNPDVWNALLAAADNAQRAHRAVLAGKAADVRAAGKVHDDAVEKALKATLALLAKAGHPAADATKHAIGTTLRALPGDEPPGRLTRTLQPAGFAILTGVSVASGAAKPARPAPARSAPAPASTPHRPKVDAKALTRARHAAASATRALRDAENAARRAEFEKVRTEREETRAAEAMEKARETAKRAASDLEQAEAAAGAATRLRESAARRAVDVREALSSARDRAESADGDLNALEKGTGMKKTKGKA
jgi:hypothetical protein